MTDHAIVIGIDAYVKTEWALSAACRDATAFARWVTAAGAGRARPDTLTLLLSPLPGEAPTDLQFAAATRKAIHDAFDRYSRRNAGRGSERLWVFCAGHGVAPPGGGADAAPVIVPADVEDINDYLNDQPLQLARYLSPLQLCEPNEQIFFFDTCRGIVDPVDDFTVSLQLHFDLKKLATAAGAATKQAVLYATTIGQLAGELGLHGVFSKALLEGLQGQGARLVPDLQRLDFALTFDALVKYAQERVRELSEEADLRGRPLPTQVPTPDLFNTTGALTLARFKEPPRAKLKIHVTPPAAVAGARAGVIVYDEMQGIFRSAGEQGPPVPNPVGWDLPLGPHRVEVSCAGYEDWSRDVLLSRDTSLPAELERAALEVSNPVDLGVDRGAHMRSLGERVSELNRGTGHVGITCPDRYARIEVFDAAGRRVAAAWHETSIDLHAGPYHVEVTLPGQMPRVRPILVAAGSVQRLSFDPSGELPPSLERALNARSLHVRGGCSSPSEAFGPVTTEHLGSVLAWAAWAARFPHGSMGERLRGLGVDPLESASLDDSLVQILIGDAGESDVRFVASAEVKVAGRKQERLVTLSPVSGLDGHALQGACSVAGSDSLLVRGEGLRPMGLPIDAVPGHVHVVVLVREASGQIELHRYLHPLRPQAARGLAFSDIVRRVELNFRALQSRVKLLPGEAEEQLAHDNLDPLAIAVLGYRLAREGRIDELDQPRADGASPLALVRQRASELPDIHVLSAMVERARSVAGWEGHMEAAARRGLPVVADGYEALFDWLAARNAAKGLPPPFPQRPFVAGGVWSVFDGAAEPRGFAGDGVLVSDALKPSGPPWFRAALSVAAVTARITTPAYLVTAFVVGPGLLLTCLFEAESFETMPQWKVSAGDGLQARALNIRGRRTIEASLGVVHVALVEVERGIFEQPPVRLRWDAPQIGDRIAVIGHSAVSGNVPGDGFATVLPGEKVVLPGEVLAIEPAEGTFRYGGRPLAGAAGGPVVDLTTGEVLGVHFARLKTGADVWVGVGIMLSSLRDDPLWMALDDRAGLKA